MDDQELLDAFRAQFPALAAATMGEMASLLGSPHVAPWYRMYRMARARERAVPEHWSNLGLVADEWAAAQANKPAVKTALKAHADAVYTASRAFDAALARANQALDQALTALSPLERVLTAGYNQLPLERQFAVERGPADQRDTRLAAQLAAMRAIWLARARAGEDPFRG